MLLVFTRALGCLVHRARWIQGLVPRVLARAPLVLAVRARARVRAMLEANPAMTRELMLKGVTFHELSHPIGLNLDDTKYVCF